MSPQRQPKYSLQRQATWIVVGLAILLIALIAVPPVRAQLIQWIRIGAVEIFRLEPTPTPSPVAPSVPAVSPSLTPAPTPTILHSPLDLAGQTTLEAAREKVVSFPIRLPGYPEDLGEPDQIYLQNPGGPVVIMVWFEEGSSGDIRMVLYEIGPTAQGFEKFDPRVIEETTVNGQPAVWVVGPYMLKARNGDMRVARLIEGATLIWVEDEITYRLETNLTLDEARQIADSLQPAVP